MSNQLQDDLDEIKRQKDTYLTPQNLRLGVTCLGVEGNLEPDKPDQTKSCTPSTSAQTITADTGYELAQVNVSAVTSDIDSDIQPSNIKKNVNILGVIGTMPTETEVINRYFDTTLTSQAYKYEDVVEKNPAFSTSTLITMESMFENCNLKEVDTTGFNTSNVTDLSGFCKGSTKLISFNKSGLNTSNVTTMAEMFSGCTSLITIDLSSIDTGRLTSTELMFNGCSSLESINLKGWNTTSITNMSHMFDGCSNLTSLNLIGFDFTNVSSYTDIFKDIPYDCTIYVSSQDAEDWILAVRSDFTNISIIEDIWVSSRNNTGLFYSVNDGASWNATNISTSPGVYNKLIYDGEKLFAASTNGSGNNMLYSYDGKTWLDTNQNVNGDLLDFNDDKTVYLSIRSSSQIYKSNDGIAWTQITSNIYDATRAVSSYRTLNYYKGMWTLIGASNSWYYIYQSTDDGVTWTTVQSSVREDSLARPMYISKLNGKLYGVNGFKVLTSQDGITWTTLFTDSSRFSGLDYNYGAYQNGIYLFSGASDYGAIYVWTSSDGTNFTKSNIATTASMPSHKFTGSGNGIFIRGATPNSGSGDEEVYTSVNGTTWSKVATISSPSDSSQWLYGIVFKPA